MECMYWYTDSLLPAQSEATITAQGVGRCVTEVAADMAASRRMVKLAIGPEELFRLEAIA